MEFYLGEMMARYDLPQTLQYTVVRSRHPRDIEKNLHAVVLQLKKIDFTC